ncbi:MAG: cAMP-activated global transcriptional regulator CRP [Halieaceae bacterium]|jgi:CRP/FNR family cyclic AMP-dependent transcriptional regulator|uniref:cAMP-activated global transcriptional regulator CRP n=1 Tax=Haliea alexandrii TaxID=2448162 RepID=UPI000F0B6141|nr:cAMP-activated global transcriptional regulator CRP [Haliea alexandrii]MCR9185079.1 cAMP-activated global transcriptional regulator CRP [Halieaceae bacterium]
MLKHQVTSAIPGVENFLRHCNRSIYRAKHAILQEGADCDRLFLILDGSVSVMVQDENDADHMMVVSYLNAGDFFGEMGLFGASEEVRSAMVVAREQCEVAEISYARFHQIRSHYPDILFAIANQMGMRLRQTTRKLKDLAFVDVSGRIAHTLIDLCKQPDAMTHPDGMQIKVTRQELGKIVGCSREMAGRVLKNLEEEGLVAVSGKTMVVLGTR